MKHQLSTENYSDQPLITAIVACYSGDQHLLPRALSSVVEQFPGEDILEIIVVFDGTPNDEVAEVCKNFGVDVLLGTGEPTGYYTQPRNLATLVARGHYIANLDADNEWAPGHLKGLLTAIRTPHPFEGLPVFTYSRRRYISDGGAQEGLPTGDSPFQPWDNTAYPRLAQGPMNNFVDSSDFLVGKAALFRLAENTGCIWEPSRVRFGDWELVLRMASLGFKGQAVNQVTNLYHWTGKNLQITRRDDVQLTAVPRALLEKIA